VKKQWIEVQKQHSYPVNAIGVKIDSKDQATLKVWREEGIDQYMLKEGPEEDASPVGEAGVQPHRDADLSPGDADLPEKAREDTGPPLDQMPSGPGAATIWAMQQMRSNMDQSDG
jgi:hypothetical protein